MDLIKRALEALSTALSEGLPADEAKKRAEIHIRQQFGGERVYVQRLPKQIRQVQVQQLGTCTQAVTAERTGLSVRQIRRIKNGK